ncbi:hypothetical protein PPL_07485 [Heterostelium album PN500]|uniref:AD domain-containing protein n=1 Tax=Heterostelium pallidum (strain ATCC 26659 / Pp 5 / PN500) TaxID=670386 RepID=D3BG34_HETP5|nr:hypothetical protein PPL_07485 [Heterostelium album PN500]EFA79626.1 hypothetical protein PPL_07485 [Heterostelium album PN500]|eukprot:XP_020431747.1 hypothetical protein PPL_07485 [Heterostelium album PN500]
MDNNSNDKFTWMIGLRVRIKNTLAEQFEGEIFSYDPTTTCITLLSEDGSLPMSRKHIVRVILESTITEVSVIGSPEDSSTPSTTTQSICEMTTLPAINLQSIQKRCDKALYQAQIQASKIGVGVTQEAQEIFYSLSKTLPCSWQGKTIVVLDEIKISSPYTVDSCVGSNHHSLERVKQIVCIKKVKQQTFSPFT